jgi:hypothetical protein
MCHFLKTSFALIAVILVGVSMAPPIANRLRGATPQPPEAAHSPLTLYVAPDGSDTWSGKLARPAADRRDGPLATLTAARDAIRALKKTGGGKLPAPLNVRIAPGHYALAEPFTLEPIDSGTADCPITYAADDAKNPPLLDGGRRIEGWKKITPAQGPLKGRQVWAAPVPDAAAGKWSFDSLWINDHPAVPTRWPAKGVLRIPAVPDASSNPNDWLKGQKRFQFVQGDLKDWPNLAGATAVVMDRWVESQMPVEKIDLKDRAVVCTKASIFSLEAGDVYYLRGALEFLAEAGQFALDAKAGTLYYLPRAGEDMAVAVVVAPNLGQVLVLAGQPQQGLFVEHVHFRDLTISHTHWALPAGQSGFEQAAVGVPGAVQAQGARECSWQGCRIVHVGTYAIDLAAACRDNRIEHCELADLGAGGVKIGTCGIPEAAAMETSGNRVTDCHIVGGGRIFHSAVGVWIGQSPRNTIAHNEIADLYYTGISVGWTWGYKKATCDGNLIEFNHVHHIGTPAGEDGPILSDMGGVYTLGEQRGTVIRNNVFHDIAGRVYGGWGIYFDEGTSHILAEKNVIYHTTHGGLHQHYGKENTVRNNVFAFGREIQLQRSRKEPHLSFTFERNIVYWNQGQLLGGLWDDFDKYAMDRNCYWAAAPAGPPKFAGMDFQQWQAKGQDKSSVVADPLFVNPSKADFRLQKGSPALKLGFEPIDTSTVGPRP